MRFGRLPVWRFATLALLAAVMIAPSAAIATDHANTTAMAPAKGQSDPTNLLTSKIVPEVASAVVAVNRDSPLPKAIVPSAAELSQENKLVSYDIPRGCQPSFGSGTTSHVCKLGDSSSKVVVAVVGDSHAGMWMPALIKVADEEHFAVVPLDKPGCFVNRLHEDLSGFPCTAWYRWAVKQDRALRPSATIVSFDTSSSIEQSPSTTTSDLRAVLSQVINGVVLQDPPQQSEQPSSCLAQASATMRTCSTLVPADYAVLAHDITAMTDEAHRPVIPTLQWFCGRGICPMIIDHTLTTRDIGHLTMEYSTALAPLFAPELRRVLARYGKQVKALSAA